MWVKRTAEKMEAVVRVKRSQRVRYAIVAGLITAVPYEFFFGGAQADKWHTYVVPGDQLLSRLPLAIIVGACFGLITFKVLLRSKREYWVCTKCEATKYADGVVECSCGGRFENLDEVKFIPENLLTK